MTIKRAQIVGFILASVLGTLLHFLFEWTGQWPPIGAVSVVNESVWEHTKLLSMPMLLYAIAEYIIYGKDLCNFLPVRLLSILLGIAIITAGYYTYTGIVGHDVMAANIILFELALLAAYIYSYRTLKTKRFCSSSAKAWAALGIVALAAVYVIFTYYPPQIGWFVDPQTGGYGISY